MLCQSELGCNAQVRSLGRLLYQCQAHVLSWPSMPMTTWYGSRVLRCTAQNMPSQGPALEWLAKPSALMPVSATCTIWGRRMGQRKLMLRVEQGPKRNPRWAALKWRHMRR